MVKMVQFHIRNMELHHFRSDVKPLMNRTQSCSSIPYSKALTQGSLNKLVMCVFYPGLTFLHSYKFQIRHYV